MKTVEIIGYCTACGAPVQAYTHEASATYKTCHHDEAPIAWVRDDGLAAAERLPKEKS